MRRNKNKEDHTQRKGNPNNPILERRSTVLLLLCHAQATDLSIKHNIASTFKNHENTVRGQLFAAWGNVTPTSSLALNLWSITSDCLGIQYWIQ